MDDGSKPPLIGLIILLGFAAYLAFTETAIASVSKNKIKIAAEHGDSRAKKAMSVLESFEKAITTILICNNIVHVSIATVVTTYVTRRWGVSFVSLSTIITTLVVFFAGEMLPKSIAKKYSYKITLGSSSLLYLLMKICAPFAQVLTAIGNTVAKHSKSDEVTVTEDELQDIIEDMTEDGSLEEEQSELISSAIQFKDVTVESIITPRVDIVAIDIDENPEKIVSIIKNQSHSRLPVYKNTIDNIVGVLRVRKFMQEYMNLGHAPEISKLIGRVHYAHQSTQIHELLPIMSKSKTNLAVITDNYGGTLGIVTVEDILEELVGEIWDESDIVEEPVKKISDTKYLVDAEELITDVFNTIDFEDPLRDEEDETNLQIGEWVYSHFTSIPKNGESFNYYNLKITVAKIEHNRLFKIQIEIMPVSEGDEK